MNNNNHIELDKALFNLLAKEKVSNNYKNSHRPILSDGLSPKAYEEYFSMVWNGFPENIFQQIKQTHGNLLVFSNFFDNRLIEIELENEKVVSLRILN